MTYGQSFKRAQHVQAISVAVGAAKGWALWKILPLETKTTPVEFEALSQTETNHLK